jgi:Papain-like cysteine protease AvrRpt2
MGILQGLCSYNGLLHAVWKGETEDDRLFHSVYNGQDWTEQEVIGGNSSHGPSAANFRGEMVLAWKGKYSDERLFCLRVSNDQWSGQTQIPGVASSVGPTLAEFDNNLYAAWKGAETDQAIWYAHFDGVNWSAQATIPDVATSVGPSLATFNGRLYAAWKGMNNDQAIWFSSFAANQWSGQQMIPRVASSHGPSLAVYKGRLYAAWKGVPGDEAIWFSSFDGASWTPQQTIPGVASSIGPTLSQYAGNLVAMWKGSGDDQGLYFASFDGSQWAAQQRVPGNTGQDEPQNMGIRMQFQETTQWCWIAVATSIAQFYGIGNVYQCALMTTIGQAINKWPSTVMCCPTTAMEQANPNLVGLLANPYAKSAEFALEAVGIPQVCIKSGGVNDALAVNNNLADIRGSMSLSEVAAEVSNGRPVVAFINWNAGGQHVVAVAGVLNDRLRICDPANGESVIGFGDFPAQYAGGATLGGWVLTQAN